MNYNEILKYFPREIGQAINETLMLNKEYNLEEIRFRSNNPIILKFNIKEIIINKKINTEDILQILQTICENSIYSYQNEICEGFITIKGGHRIGITGNVVFDDNKIKNINYISSLNFRIARQIIGCSDNILKYIIDEENNTIFNTLIISSPGGGKTTILRDIIRNLSNGTKVLEGKNVSLIDERGEIAAMYKGISQNDIGIRTDVMSNIKKSIGMKMAIRSMAPEIIVADEIGDIDDVEAINYGMCCGIKGIFTAHGDNIKDLEINPAIKVLLEKKLFSRIFVLDKKNKGKLKNCINLNKDKFEYNELLM